MKYYSILYDTAPTPSNSTCPNKGTKFFKYKINLIVKSQNYIICKFIIYLLIKTTKPSYFVTLLHLDEAYFNSFFFLICSFVNFSGALTEAPIDKRCAISRSQKFTNSGDGSAACEERR